MPLTVGELREVLEDLPDNMPVGVSGWFGEFHPFDFAPKVQKPRPGLWSRGDEPARALLFDHVEIGDEPD